MTAQKKIDPAILEQAADWLLRLREEDADASVAFLNWMEESTVHREAFDQIEECWLLAGEIELAPDARGFAPETPSRQRSERAVQGGRGRSQRLMLAASIVLALVGAGVVGFLNLPSGGATHVERIVTDRSQHQSTTLPDGSRVELGGLSAVSVRFSGETRMVVVDSGDAFYEVEKDPNRPFVVQAGPVTVTAVGTKFSVRREGDAVSVIVTEGIVDVSANPSLRAKPSGETRTRGLTLRATAGERVRFDRGELSQTVEQLRPDTATSWRSGRLEFVDEPLRLVVASVNRYSAREIVIDDPMLAELRFTGTVFENEVPSWLKGVETVFGAHVVEIDKRRVLITTKSKANLKEGGAKR
jgi:transmembrane sensor